VLGTRERLCPFHLCKGPKSRPTFCHEPGPTPPRWAQSMKNSRV
jgi:hypothetical protein